MANQPLLFNPDLHPVQYALENGNLEITLDGGLKTFWLSQKQIAAMLGIDVRTVSHHIQQFKENRPEAAIQGIQLYKIPTAGGTQNVEHYNHKIVIYIGYRAQATDKTIRFQEFVEEVFRQRLEDEHARAIKKAQHGHAVKVTGYVLAGMTQSHAEKRVDVTNTLKQLNAIIIELTDASMIGRVLSREYRLLFDKMTDELKRILNTKNIRDSLPELQLDYIKLAEKTLVMQLSRYESLTSEQLLAIVDKTVRPLGEHLKMVCESMSIDLVTGRKQLGRGS